MPVEVRLPDLVRLELVDPSRPSTRSPNEIAKRLGKAGLIDHFNFRNSIFTLARRASGDCQFLDARTRRCTVYENARHLPPAPAGGPASEPLSVRGAPRPAETPGVVS